MKKLLIELSDENYEFIKSLSNNDVKTGTENLLIEKIGELQEVFKELDTPNDERF